jgi:DNA-binding NarL/FixJ family response regulator
VIAAGPVLKFCARRAEEESMSSLQRLRIAVVDDHELLRRGLTALLPERGIDVVAEFSTAADAIAHALEHDPHVVMLELSMPGMSGVELTRQLIEMEPGLPIVVLTTVEDGEHVADALLAGVRGYLLKDSPIEHIIDGIRSAARGDVLLSPRIAARLIQRLREPGGPGDLPAAPDLTDQQLEILQLIARGIDNQMIADALFLSEHTVKNHVSGILEKLRVQNRVQAAVRAVQVGLVP